MLLKQREHKRIGPPVGDEHLRRVVNTVADQKIR